MPDHPNESKKAAVVRANRGILTERDRSYIRGVSDVESGSAHERMIRQAIRERLTEALLDFSLLLDHPRPDDFERVMRELDSTSKRPGENLGMVIAFVYLAAAYQPEASFESIVERGTSIGAEYANEVVKELFIDVSTYSVDLEASLEQLVDGDGVTLPEFQQLLRSDALPMPDQDVSGVSFHLEFDEPFEGYEDVRIRLEERT